MINDIAENGYYNKHALLDYELKKIRSIVNNQYLEIIKKYYPAYSHTLPNIFKYHEISENFNHSKLWIKKNRIISKANVDLFKNLHLYKLLKKYYGNIRISNEELNNFEEIYWRIARPNNPDDVGSLHADRWFWEIDNKIDLKEKRLKVWIPLYCNNNDSGFLYAHKSHKKKFNYSLSKNELRKKFIIENEDNLEINKHLAYPGNVIVFHDNLIHGGYMIDKVTRVSIEFTIIIEN